MKDAKKPDKKQVVVRHRPTALSSGYERAVQQGGGIQPGAHPEVENLPTGLDNPIAAIKKLARRLKPKRAAR